MSLESATFWFDVSNLVLLLGAMLVLAGTWGIYKTGAIKEQYSDNRIAANEAAAEIARAESESAKSDASKAHQRAAEANARAEDAKARVLKAQLDLERYKAPRVLTEQQKARLKSELVAFSGQQFSGIVAASVSDADHAWASIADALTAANWVLVHPLGESKGEPPAGITLFPHSGVSVAIPTQPSLTERQIATRLVALLNEFGIAASAFRDTGPKKMKGTIKIVIGPKP